MSITDARLRRTTNANSIPQDYNPPCSLLDENGRPALAQLFDSTNLVDHLAARSICNTACRVKDACKLALRSAQDTYGTDPRVGPEGTWAGELIAHVDPRKRAECGTAPGYRRHRKRRENPCEDCRAAEAEQVRERRTRKGGDAA